MYCRMPYLPGLLHPWDKYCSTPEARRLFMRSDGSMLERGDPYRNPDLAESLRAIARHGASEFYTGALAETVMANFERNGLFVTREDLAGLTSCSGVVVPGTGFTWNDCVALMDPVPGRPNSYVPGRARASALATTIVVPRRGAVARARRPRRLVGHLGNPAADRERRRLPDVSGGSGRCPGIPQRGLTRLL